MDFGDWISVALFVLAVFDWSVVVILFRVSRRAHADGAPIHSLDDRGRVAAAIASASTIGVVLGVNRHFSLGIPPDAVLLMFVALVLLPSLVNAWFLLDLIRGRFGK